MTNLRNLRRPSLLSLLVLVISSSVVPAQDVQWSSNYSAARREAVQAKRPLLLSFCSDNCYWCKRLDAGTFRDPAIVRIMNNQFVALKVDASRDDYLPQALGITRYPTLIVASPEGKVLDVHEGYEDAARFEQRLQRALAAGTGHDPMMHDYTTATQAIATSDYPRAITLLKKILGVDRQHVVRHKAQEALDDLEQHAANHLARAKELRETGLVDKASSALVDVSRNYAGTQAAREAAEILLTAAQ